MYLLGLLALGNCADHLECGPGTSRVGDLCLPAETGDAGTPDRGRDAAVVDSTPSDTAQPNDTAQPGDAGPPLELLLWPELKLAPHLLICADLSVLRRNGSRHPIDATETSATVAPFATDLVEPALAGDCAPSQLGMIGRVPGVTTALVTATVAGMELQTHVRVEVDDASLHVSANHITVAVGDRRPYPPLWGTDGEPLYQTRLLDRYLTMESSNPGVALIHAPAAGSGWTVEGIGGGTTRAVGSYGPPGQTVDLDENPGVITVIDDGELARLEAIELRHDGITYRYGAVRAVPPATCLQPVLIATYLGSNGSYYRELSDEAVWTIEAGAGAIASDPTRYCAITGGEERLRGCTEGRCLWYSFVVAAPGDLLGLEVAPASVTVAPWNNLWCPAVTVTVTDLVGPRDVTGSAAVDWASFDFWNLTRVEDDGIPVQDPGGHRCFSAYVDPGSSASGQVQVSYGTAWTSFTLTLEAE